MDTGSVGVHGGQHTLHPRQEEGQISGLERSFWAAKKKATHGEALVGTHSRATAMLLAFPSWAAHVLQLSVPS